MLSKLIDPKVNINKDAFVINTETNPDYEFPKNMLPPQLKVQKVSTSFYKVQIVNATPPFVLALNQTYDNLWEAKVGDEIIPKHFIANGFANGWVIDNKKGDFEINLVFKIWPWE
jgi:hypothetical protein